MAWIRQLFYRHGGFLVGTHRRGSALLRQEGNAERDAPLDSFVFTWAWRGQAWLFRESFVNMTSSDQCALISNRILRRKLSLLKAYGKMPDAIKKTFCVDDTHCFELWADGRPVETISLKLTEREAARLETEIDQWLSHPDKVNGLIA